MIGARFESIKTRTCVMRAKTRLRSPAITETGNEMAESGKRGAMPLKGVGMAARSKAGPKTVSALRPSSQLPVPSAFAIANRSTDPCSP